MHPDARTNAPDTEYFFLGDGRISAAVQWSHNPAISPYGLLLMHPEMFYRKESTLLFHPELGLSRTMLTVTVGGIRHRPQHEDLRVWWKSTDSENPAVAVEWKAGELRVCELFTLSRVERKRLDESDDEREPYSYSYLVRQVFITATQSIAAPHATVELAFYPNPYVLESYPVAIDAQNKLVASGKGVVCQVSPQAEEKEGTLFERFIAVRRALNSLPAPITFLYSITEKSIGIDSHPCSPTHPQSVPASQSNRTFVERLLCQLDISRIGLKAAISAEGRFDASIWQYGYEWGQDAAMIASAAAYAGEFVLADRVLRRILETLSNEKGQIAESSRFRDGELAELNANGAVLLALRDYAAISGDKSHMTQYWERIVAIAELPLHDEYLHESGLIAGRRDLWERLPWMGLLAGFDTATNTFCAEGLCAAAELATMHGDNNNAERWRAAGEAMRRGMLAHERFSCIADGRVIHRRLMDGSVQQWMTAEAGYHDPRYAPYAPTQVTDPTPRPCDPDSTAALPILYGILDPTSQVAQQTLAHLREHLWDTTGIGGYARSPIASDPDSPGPWPFVTAWMGEAELRGGMTEQARETTEWLLDSAGEGGSWFEYYGQRQTPPFPPIGVIVWGWGQYLLLAVRGWMGIEFTSGVLRIAPRIVGFRHTLRVGDYRIEIDVSGLAHGTVNGSPTRLHNGGIELELPITENYNVQFSP